MGKKKVLILVLVLVLLLGAAGILYKSLSGKFQTDQLATTPPATGAADPSGEATEPPQMPAPDFTMTDREGNEVSLSDFIGKPVVLNFWASWCGPCRMEMPDFDKAYRELGDEIHFLMVNMTDGQRETVEKASAHVDEAGFTFPVYFDTAQDAAVTYQVTSLPTTYFIDAEGNLVARAMGAIDAATLERGIGLIAP